jgi:conjugal transfer pilus assembly protein TraI
LNDPEDTREPPAPNTTGKEVILTSPVSSQDPIKSEPAGEKANHLSPALARLFAVNTQAEKKHENPPVTTPVKEAFNRSNSATVQAPIAVDQPGAEEKETLEDFTLLSGGEVTELEYVEIATMLHHILTKLSGSFKRKRKNRFMVLTQNTFF